jgi:hypothetical protein
MDFFSNVENRKATLTLCLVVVVVFCIYRIGWWFKDFARFWMNQERPRGGDDYYREERDQSLRYKNK